jgi:hypothetical protein
MNTLLFPLPAAARTPAAMSRKAAGQERVGHFDPALTAADHAAHEDQAIGVFAPISQDLMENGGEIASGN